MRLWTKIRMPWNFWLPQRINISDWHNRITIEDENCISLKFYMATSTVWERWDVKFARMISKYTCVSLIARFSCLFRHELSGISKTRELLISQTEVVSFITYASFQMTHFEWLIQLPNFPIFSHIKSKICVQICVCGTSVSSINPKSFNRKRHSPTVQSKFWQGFGVD